MDRILRAIAVLSALSLLAAAPHHVQTADYWKGYSGTKKVPAQLAARSLTWAETDKHGAAEIAPLGVKTILYTNPNREQPGDPMWSTDEAVYAHTCSGMRAMGETAYAGQQLTQPGPTLAKLWRWSVAQHVEGATFNAVFNDEAVGAAYAVNQPCNFDFNRWLQQEAQLQHSLGWPVIYNGLGDYYNHGVAREIALNRTAIGGMMEECYARLRPDHRVGGWQWQATEETELRMAQADKYFFCYGRDLTPADQAFDSRMYTYASLLLTYDPATTVLWEYYKTPTGGHVMPESQLVALNPIGRAPGAIGDLRTSTGVYERAYSACYIDARPAGPCMAVVNPDNDSHSLSLTGYRKTLALYGSGVFDGGFAKVTNQPPPGQIPPLSGIIAFK